MISNSSAISAYESLNDNGGVGLTFETGRATPWQTR